MEIENKRKYYAGTLNGTDYGFYLDKDNLLDGWVGLTEEEHDELIRLNQEEGKVIQFAKGKKPIAVDYVPSEEQKLKTELNELQTYLRETDYIAAKIAEGAATKEEYKTELDKRQKARDRINEIKADLKIE